MIPVWYNDVIYLIAVTYTTDPVGNQIPTETERMIYANDWEVNSKEFYDAATQGLKPEKSFQIFAHEYQGETKLRHGNTVYNIIRAQTRGEKTWLTCERDVGDG